MSKIVLTSNIQFFLWFSHSIIGVAEIRETENQYGLFSSQKKRYMSHVMRKPTFCICKNKDADQLRGDREADQRLCFRYWDSTIPLLPKAKISSL